MVRFSLWERETVGSIPALPTINFMDESRQKYNLIIGRHVPVKSPFFLLGAVQEAVSYEANSLMIFLGAPQNSYRRNLTELKALEFKQALIENKIGINNVIVHAPYILNLANTINKNIFNWSVEFLKEEINRMEKIGLETIVLHPGSVLSAELEKGLVQVSQGLNWVLQANSTTRIALETMCGRKGEVGGSFEQLKYIIDRVEQKERVGVC